MTGSAGERIAFLSDHFHGIPYLENTLVGGANTDEVFVVNLASVDCYTLIDYIEAMRLSSSFEDFVEFLKKIRYRAESYRSGTATISSPIGVNSMASSLRMPPGRSDFKIRVLFVRSST